MDVLNLPADRRGQYSIFLDPAVVQQLGPHLAFQQVLQALKLEQYTVESLEQHLRTTKPAWRNARIPQWRDSPQVAQ